MPRKSLVGVVLTAFVFSTAACSGSIGDGDGGGPGVRNLDAPIIVSHRGGAAVYPEHSMEGYRASAADGYLPEMDLHALADGTIVCIHDDTVDRTMTGVRGKVADLTLAEWMSGRIVSPTGGDDAAPVTWDEVLDEFAGDVAIVPELKASDPEVVDEVVGDIIDRGLEDSVIVQSFDWEVAQEVARAGIPSLYLFGKETPRPPEDILAAGVEFVGPSWKIGTDAIAALSGAGLKVMPYTINDPAVAADVLDAGAVGFFTDDAWNVDEALGR